MSYRACDWVEMPSPFSSVIQHVRNVAGVLNTISIESCSPKARLPMTTRELTTRAVSPLCVWCNENSFIFPPAAKRMVALRSASVVLL